ncbi:MAG: hypothetical protein Q9211_001283 [Gyalolechia sp. 1 TL-2023]
MPLTNLQNSSIQRPLPNPLVPTLRTPPVTDWLNTGVEFLLAPSQATFRPEWSLASSPSSEAQVEITQEVLEDGKRTNTMRVHSMEPSSTGKKRALREDEGCF